MDTIEGGAESMTDQKTNGGETVGLGAYGFQRWANRISAKNFAYLLLIPAVIIVVVLGIFPVAYSLGLSLFKYKLNTPHPARFVGLSNYAKLLTNIEFWDSIVKTLYFTVAVVGLTTLVAMLVALLLNQDIRGKTFLIAMLLIPWAVPKVVNGLIWRWIYDGNYGILNAIALKLGLIDKYQWWFVRSPITALNLVVIVEVWKRVPFSAILLLATLQNIPPHLYRAAKIDGANVWQRFRFVTFPGLKYMLMVVLILSTTWTLKTFDTIYVLTKGGPGTNTMVAYYYVYRESFEYLNMGLGSAGAYILTLLALLLAVFYFRLLRSK
jgi:multiple sugar transport system permease protein